MAMEQVKPIMYLFMRNYDENNACNYVYMNICKPPIII